ncbi:sugar ABC transporter substrate-binding protein [Pseudonocardia sp. GCM10023141]|uniref:sugar ABC transporter substrate-binding protein n=1 Tax=Pseudonocardia sp. GCM10023141 TaxID=3252653 RepID=UPI0036096B0D
MLAAACTTSRPSGNAAGEPVAAAPAAASAVPVGPAQPDSVPVPKKTIGLLQYVGASYVQKQLTDELVRAATALGWDVVVKDGQGQPALIAASAQAFVQSNVDAFVSIANPPSAIQASLQAFHDRGTPIIGVAGIVQDPGGFFDAILRPSDAIQGAMAADYLEESLAPGSTIVAQRLDGLLGVKIRADAFTSGMDNYGFATVATHQMDVSNLVSDTISSVRDQLTANPKAAAVYSSIDSQFGPICNLLNERGQTSVKVLAMYTFPDTVKALQTCPNGVIIDSPNWWTGWQAVDILLHHWTKNAPFSAAAETAKYPYPYVVVTRDTMPPDLPSYPFEDLGATLYSAWKAEGYHLAPLAPPTVATR